MMASKKLYPINLERAESTLMWAISVLGQVGSGEAEAEARRLHEVDMTLRKARVSERGNALIAWIDGQTFGAIKSAEAQNAARWAAMNAAVA